MSTGSAGVSPASKTDDATGWRSRGYLPHFDRPGLIQMITFRLADSLPAAVLAQIALEKRPSARRERIESWLDQGYGACHLRNPEIALLVQHALWYFDHVRYHLIAWVVMPNHVHTIIEPMSDQALSAIVQSWKSFTAKKANETLGTSRRFWQPEYFDRVIRDERHLETAVRYIHENPVRAGLASRPEGWAFSSAAKHGTGFYAGGTPALPGR